MSSDSSAFTAWKAIQPFLNGGLGGMGATLCIQPLDTIKVRIQLGAKGGPITVGKSIIQTEGVKTLYKGLSAGLFRQSTYTTARMGIHNKLTSALEKLNDGKTIPVYQKAGAGLLAGGMGAFIGSPADLILIRMQSDKTLPPAMRRNYKGLGDAFVKIVKADGVTGLFRGATPTVIRACALNVGMFTSNGVAKDALVSYGYEKSSSVVVLGSALIASIFASATSLPLDFVKTRMLRQTRNADGTMPYTSPLDCILKTLKNDGPLKFYSGFGTYCMRVAPQVVLMLVFVDALQKLEKNMGL